MQTVIDNALAAFDGVSLVGMVDIYNDPTEKLRTGTERHTLMQSGSETSRSKSTHT